MALACPSTGIIYDTIQSTLNSYSDRYFALNCGSSTSFDLSEMPSRLSGRHSFRGSVLANFSGCVSTSPVLTVKFSSKYDFASASPSPSAITGNTITWNLGTLTEPQSSLFNFHLERPGGMTTWLTPGDTVHTSYSISPSTGDADTTNNTTEAVDTVRSSFDPNEMSVSPEGFIDAGTQLQYTINFENTGNDTAHNISIMDTLSNNVNIHSLKILAASSAMNTAIIHEDGYNIVKFDFPAINLLDSSHHNQCDGVVMFNINALPGLAPGTLINNRAGIFFDDNEVVMTNSVQDIIKEVEGTNRLVISKVELFPNPATDELTVKADAAVFSTLTICNSMGQALICRKCNVQSTINVSMLPQGLYYITLKGAYGIRTLKFIKE
jgi:uncharacterized repeat protein (TIGR01451 family)